MSEVFLYVYVTSVGFVCAGIIASFTKLVTGRPLGFVIHPHLPTFFAVPAVFARVFGGPFILARNSIRGALIENRPAHFLVLSISLATVWSFFAGAVVLETVFHLGKLGF